jgi:4-hydroxy-3-methylbut-2-enyl diphosphate reductase
VKREWLENVTSVGVCGVTSTPLWLMEEVAKKIMVLTDKPLK